MRTILGTPDPEPRRITAETVTAATLAANTVTVARLLAETVTTGTITATAVTYTMLGGQR